MSMRVYSIKLPEEMVARIDALLAKRIHTSREIPLDRSKFIRRAIERDFEHAERSRIKKRKGDGNTAPATTAPQNERPQP